MSTILFEKTKIDAD